jgi:multidrug efflux pump subunit AcrB
MWLVKLSLKSPYAIGVLTALIVVLGLVAMAAIPVDILPAFKAPAVQVPWLV